MTLAYPTSKLPTNFTLACQEFSIPSLSYDYMIWSTNVVQNWDTLIGNWKRIDTLQGMKAWWSFDNHHNFKNEIVHAGHFDCCFLAHANHVHLYHQIEHYWLPLAVVQFTIDEVLELLPEIVCANRIYDLQFRGVHYTFLQRDRKVWLDKWFDRAEAMGLKTDYSLQDGASSIVNYFKQDFRSRAASWLLANASICAPIQDDLSTRFFDGFYSVRTSISRKRFRI